MNIVLRAPASPSEPYLLSMSGDLDVVSVPDALERVSALVADAGALVVDLQEVSFLDSSGVRMLHRLAHRCAASGTGLRVVAPPQSRARRVLDIVGMTLLVDDDLAAALAALQDRPDPG